MLEAALVLPLALLIFFSSIGLGLAVYQHIVVSDAVRTAGRMTAISAPSSLNSCEKQVEKALHAHLDRFGISNKPTLSTTIIKSSGVRGIDVHVVASLPCEICQAFFIKGNFLRFEVESYYPLENQSACT